MNRPPLDECARKDEVTAPVLYPRPLFLVLVLIVAFHHPSPLIARRHRLSVWDGGSGYSGHGGPVNVSCAMPGLEVNSRTATIRKVTYFSGK
jgi:hypothetical protein